MWCFIIYLTKQSIMSFLSKLFDSSSYTLSDADYVAIAEWLEEAMHYDSDRAELRGVCEGELSNGYGFTLSGTVDVLFGHDAGSYYTPPATTVESITVYGVDFVLYDLEGDRVDVSFSAKALEKAMRTSGIF